MKVLRMIAITPFAAQSKNILTQYDNLSLKIFEWLVKNRGESQVLKRPLELKLI